ncbi:hypothetical protein HAX54_020386 [Datura stramonium]|uniref:Uncharacterized protein n=1 Tax=Datura stramonium TaxID=4076 RepID=A0ABS8UR55_DATST|nr:hypothetical protein [Datura stramonium]
MDFLDAMPKLRHLEIRDCPLLEALSDGLVNLISLQQLTLSNCKKLEHLPSRDAMRRLTKLQCLEVRRCPKLEESCTNQSGPNSQWSKISHIPVIKVGERTIQNLGRRIHIAKWLENHNFYPSLATLLSMFLRLCCCFELNWYTGTPSLSFDSGSPVNTVIDRMTVTENRVEKYYSKKNMTTEQCV